MFEVMIVEIEHQDAFNKMAPFWAKRLRAAKKIENLILNKKIRINHTEHTTSMTLYDACISGEIHGFTYRYRDALKDKRSEHACEKCVDCGDSLCLACYSDDKSEFEYHLNNLVKHVMEKHPSKIPSQGAWETPPQLFYPNTEKSQYSR